MTDKCTVSIGSITYASKAQKALASASIPAEIVKTERSGLGSGCVYGSQDQARRRRQQKDPDALEHRCNRSDYAVLRRDVRL